VRFVGLTFKPFVDGAAVPIISGRSGAFLFFVPNGVIAIGQRQFFDSLEGTLANVSNVLCRE